MDGSHLLDEGVGALAQLFGQPFLYVGILLVALQFRRQMKLERRLFHTRLHAPAAQTWSSIGYGCLAGIAVSVPMAFAGFSIPWQIVTLIWVISVLLMLIRVRYLNIAYAAGIIGIWTAAVANIPALRDNALLAPVVTPFVDFQFASLLLLIGILHGVEGVLMRLRGTMHEVPLFLAGKRGKTVGAYQLHQWWPVPLLLIVPAHPESFLNSWSAGAFFWLGEWSFAAFPLIVGFSNFAVATLPGRKMRSNANFLLIFGLVMIALAVVADLLPWFTAGAAIAAVLIMEGANWLSGRNELRRSPIFVHDARGLKVLAVLPDSPAHEMGIVAGEIIRKVNGRPVLTKEELHLALQINPAFCKMEVINLDGQSKFAGKAIFAGDHHQLGIVLAPDDDTAFVAELRKPFAFRHLPAETAQTRQEG